MATRYETAMLESDIQNLLWSLQRTDTPTTISWADEAALAAYFLGSSNKRNRQKISKWMHSMQRRGLVVRSNHSRYPAWRIPDKFWPKC